MPLSVWQKEEMNHELEWPFPCDLHRAETAIGQRFIAMKVFEYYSVVKVRP
jgi:hypothetical protein